MDMCVCAALPPVFSLKLDSEKVDRERDIQLSI